MTKVSQQQKGNWAVKIGQEEKKPRQNNEILWHFKLDKSNIAT
jgi:hypothetical protein